MGDLIDDAVGDAVRPLLLQRQVEIYTDKGRRRRPSLARVRVPSQRGGYNCLPLRLIALLTLAGG